MDNELLMKMLLDKVGAPDAATTPPQSQSPGGFDIMSLLMPMLLQNLSKPAQKPENTPKERLSLENLDVLI